MLSPAEITIALILIIIISWWWHAYGQREYALKCIKTHCHNLNLTLLDGYVALKKITLQKDVNNKIRLARIYSFEFTVNAEQRYTGYITLYGYYVERIELPPYLINPPNTELVHQDIIKVYPTEKPFVSLDDYRKTKNNHE